MSDVTTDCRYFANGLCEVATQMANATVKPQQIHCDLCSSKYEPNRGVNVVTISLAIHYADAKKSHQLIKQHRETLRYVSYGPGTELEKLISWFKTSNKKCKCATRIARMNQWGPDECLRRIATIRRWLRHSAAVHRVPYVDAIVTALIKRAISNARKNMDSGNHNRSA